MSAITAPLRNNAAVRPSKLQQRNRLRVGHRAAGNEPFPFRVHIGLLLEWHLKQASNRLLVGVCEIVAILVWFARHRAFSRFPATISNRTASPSVCNSAVDA